MIPWTAINLIDFFFVRKGNYAIKEIFKPHGMYQAWFGWRGLTAYWIAFAAMIPFISTTVYTGFVAELRSAAATSRRSSASRWRRIVYWIFTRSLNVAEETRIAEQQMHEIDPQGAIGLGSS